MKYYPQDLDNYMEYIEIPNHFDANNHGLVLKARDLGSLIQLHGFCSRLKGELRDQIHSAIDIDNLEISLTFAENSNYITLCRRMCEAHYITKEFSNTLYKAQLARVLAAQGNQFDSPLKVSHPEKPSDMSRSSPAPSFNLK